MSFANIVENHRRSVMSFLIVGSLTAAINFCTFTILWKWFHLPYQIAVSIAFIFGVLFHFNANRIVTFRKHGSHAYSHIVKYLTMIFINYIVTLIIVHLVVENLHYSPYLGIICSIATNLGSNYLMSRFWVFTH